MIVLHVLFQIGQTFESDSKNTPGDTLASRVLLPEVIIKSITDLSQVLLCSGFRNDACSYVSLDVGKTHL